MTQALTIRGVPKSQASADLYRYSLNRGASEWRDDRGTDEVDALFAIENSLDTYARQGAPERFNPGFNSYVEDTIGDDNYLGALEDGWSDVGKSFASDIGKSALRAVENKLSGNRRSGSAPLPVASSSSSMMKKALVVGGVVAGGYLLLKLLKR